jgi:serine/threonine protein kinase
MKPSNILLNSQCQVKIADFGLSKGFEPDKKLSQYVVTRWYRPPEIMLGCKKYDAAIDVWGAGCIFGQLLCGKVLFPGTDYMDMVIKSGILKLILNYVSSSAVSFRCWGPLPMMSCLSWIILVPNPL